MTFFLMAGDVRIMEEYRKRKVYEMVGMTEWALVMNCGLNFRSE